MNFVYFDKIRKLLDVVEQHERDTMSQVVELLTQTILAKRSIFVFGASHAGIMTEELFYRAGGLMVINPIFARELMLDTSPVTHTSRMERLPGYGPSILSNHEISKGDVLIVHSVSGRNPVAIELVMEAKRRGAIIVALTNVAYSKTTTSRLPSGERLFEVADVVLDNHGDVGDACVEIKGIEQKVAATSTVIGATILNSIIAETVQQLVNHGVSTAPVFFSANVDGGDEKNQEAYREYQDMMHYDFSWR